MTQIMKLNMLSPTGRKRRKRVGRGIGSGLGKTAGRGHKGQRARSGGRRDGAFEGGQMPLHRRVPKRGFNSRLMRQTMEVRLDVVERLSAKEITLAVLRENGVMPYYIKRVKIFNSGTIRRAVTIVGMPITRGARLAVEAAGGKVV